MTLRNEIAKSNIMYAFGRSISAVIAFFLSIILPRLLRPHDFGLYTFCLLVVGFGRIFVNLGLDETLIRFTANYMSQGEYGKTGALVRGVFRYKLALTVVIASSITLFSGQIATHIFKRPEGSFLVFLAGLVLIFQSLYDFSTNLLFGTKNLAGVAVIQILQYLFRFIFVIGLVLLGLGVFGAISGYMLALIAVLIIAFVVIYKNHKFLFAIEETKIDRRTVFGFSLWLFVIITVGGAYGLVDQFMISRMLRVEDIGFYKIALSWMFAIINIMPLSAYVLFPYFSSLKEESRLNTMFFDSLKYTALFVFPLSFLLSTLSKPFVSFVYGNEFLDVVPALKILAIVAAPMMLTMVLYTFYSGIKKPEIVAKVVVGMTFVNIVLNYILIPRYGIAGAAIATLIAKTIEFSVLLSFAVLSWKLMFESSVLIKPLLASIIGASLSILLNIGSITSMVGYSIIFSLIYLAAMWLIKGFTRKDVEYLREGVVLIYNRLFSS